MARAPHRVALVGCGGIGYAFGRARKDGPGGGALSHFQAFSEHPAFRVVGVADPDPAARGEIAHMHGVPAFAEAGELLDACRADVVVIAAPDHTHPALLRQIAPFRPRAVLCEKPLAQSLAEAEALAKLYEDAGIALCVNYSRRFLPGYAALRELLASGGLGRLQSALIYYSRGFRHNASHYLDLLLWWFGEPKSIITDGRRPGLSPDDPSLSLTLGYPDGLEVRLVALEDGALRINEMDIIGSTGRLRLDTLGELTRFALTEHPDYPGLQIFAPAERRSLDLNLALPAAAETLRLWLEGAGALTSTAQDSLALHRLMDRITQEDTQ